MQISEWQHFVGRLYEPRVLVVLFPTCSYWLISISSPYCWYASHTCTCTARVHRFWHQYSSVVFCYSSCLWSIHCHPTHSDKNSKHWYCIEYHPVLLPNYCRFIPTSNRPSHTPQHRTRSFSHWFPSTRVSTLWHESGFEDRIQQLTD